MTLFFSLLLRELRSRFIGSTAGWLWLIVNPLMLLAVYALVFGTIFKARAPAHLSVPFVAWLAAGLWPWLAFSEAIQRAAESIPQHAAIISKVPIRREFLTLSAAMAAAILQLAGFVVVLLAIIAIGVPIDPWGLPLVVFVLIVITGLALALGLVAAVLRVLLPDFQHLLPTLLMIWFFSTPILYDPALVPDAIQPLVAVNPLSLLINDLREALFGARLWPSGGTIVVTGLTVVLGAFAHRFYRRISPYFEDFL
ncbi:MAG: ABC transporter permease [Wenzhouxiangellaceae bacterium]